MPANRLIFIIMEADSSPTLGNPGSSRRCGVGVGVGIGVGVGSGVGTLSLIHISEPTRPERSGVGGGWG